MLQTLPYLFFPIPTPLLLLAAAVLAIRNKNRNMHWKAVIVYVSLVILIYTPIAIGLSHGQATCQAEFCGLGDFFELMLLNILAAIFGIVTIVLSMMKVPKKTASDDINNTVVGKRHAAFILILLSPILLCFLLYLFVILYVPFECTFHIGTTGACSQRARR